MYEERNEELRSEYKQKIQPIPRENLIYLDESGFDMNMKKEFGFSKKGIPIIAEKSGNRKGKRITIISALSRINDKLLAPMYFEGNTDTEVFNTWISEFLIKELQPGKTLIMDNASFHKSPKTRELIEKAGCFLEYLPPYSPDFNPIEHKWGVVKKIVRGVRDKFTNFNDCLDYVLKCQ